jgi:16S rRNA (guanine966-N2)-methyltransferase
VGPFDLIFMDPPYNDPEAEDLLLRLPALLGEDGTVVYEHSSRYNPPQRPEGLRLMERRVYGDTAIALFSPEEEE